MSDVKNLGYEASKDKLLDISKQQHLDAVSLYESKNNCCLMCGNKIPYEKRKSKFCNRSCSATYNNLNRIKKCKPSKSSRTPPIDWGAVSKGELISRCSTWQSWRTQIRKHAHKIITDNGVEYKCHHCGYSLHNEICHIIPVSDFDDDALLNDINDVHNLIYLCPTHHWEFDNGYLELKDTQSNIDA